MQIGISKLNCRTLWYSVKAALHEPRQRAVASAQPDGPSSSSSSSSSDGILKWSKQQRHHEDHYSQSKYEQYQTVL